MVVGQPNKEVEAEDHYLTDRSNRERMAVRVIIPHVQLDHRVAAGSNPDTPTPLWDAVKQLAGGTECLLKALVLLRCDTNGTRH